MTESNVKTEATTPAAAGASAEASSTTATTDEKLAWRQNLVREALTARPELRQLQGSRQDFASSRRAGHDLGYEDGAKKLTVIQLQHFQDLKERCLATYHRAELPADLQGYLAERVAGHDETGFLAGYVDGVADFLTAYRAELKTRI